MSSELVQIEVGGRKMFARIAKVESVDLGLENHAVLTFSLTLDYGGAGQGFGGFALDEWHAEWGRRRGTAMGLDYIIRVLAAFGVGSIDKIKGKYCYALFDDSGFNALVRGIAPLPMEEGKPLLIADWQKDWDIAPR